MIIRYLETGSLISLRKNIEHIVIPSEERRIKMYPMDFEEFLEAIGHGGTLSLIRKRFSNMTPMGAAEHRMVMELFRQYLVVGGMPQSVAAFAADRNLSNVEEASPSFSDSFTGNAFSPAMTLDNVFGRYPAAATGRAPNSSSAISITV